MTKVNRSLLAVVREVELGMDQEGGGARGEVRKEEKSIRVRLSKGERECHHCENERRRVVAVRGQGVGGRGVEG